MLHDVLATLHGWRECPPVAVVTSDPFAVELASKFHFEIIPDPDNPGETGAIEMATRVCVERGVESTIVIPGDIPLITSDELHRVLRPAGRLLISTHGRSYLPRLDADERADNHLVPELPQTPGELVRLAFGPRDDHPHGPLPPSRASTGRSGHGSRGTPAHHPIAS